MIAREVSKGNFRCESCNHILDDAGHCVEYPCYTCNPYTCNNCDGRLEGGLDDDGEIHCENCDHYVDEDGDCVSSERGHCSTCDTYPDCPSCGSTTSENGYEDEYGDYIKRYSCDEGCYHEIDSDGDCRSEACNACSPIECSTCESSIYEESDSDGYVWCGICECYVDEDGDRLSSTYTCNSCNQDIEGRLDSDGEIRCDTCDHYIDSDGDCATTDCSTCQTSSYSCNKCGETVYGELDDDGEIRCDTCDHYIDSDGDCATTDCSTCDDDDDEECDECGKQPCNRGISCWAYEKGDCWYCHCGGEVERIENHKFPNCPNCEDNDDVIYDDDLSYYCNYCKSNF